MIKNIIIFILILLLSLILYSYYCISERMINYQKDRLEYILQKEEEIKIKERKIDVIENCSKKNEELINAFLNINKILDNIKDIGITKTDDINNIEILDHVPTEYIDKQ